MNEVGGVLLVLGVAAFLIAIVLNTLMWFRFTNTYDRRVGGPMPPLLFDFRGRWYRASTTQSPDPELERSRRQLRWSYGAGAAAFGVVVLGVLLLARH